jgi:hypothetical protein
MKKFLASFALAALGVTALPFEVLARGRSNHQDHYRLAETLVATGINFRVNPPRCDTKDNTYGWYWAARNELVVCQENKIYGSTREVNWTEEDYDTLRHEAHHLVQDCMAHGRRDGRLGAVYESPLNLGKEILGTSNMESIGQAYRSQGADAHTVVMEIEAFSVAAMNDPLEQVRDIQRYCM